LTRSIITYFVVLSTW